MLSTLDLAKKISIRHNVSIRVLDQNGQVISEHTGHNAATNSMITGVAHYLTGDGVLNQGYHMSICPSIYFARNYGADKPRRRR